VKYADIYTVIAQITLFFVTSTWFLYYAWCGSYLFKAYNLKVLYFLCILRFQRDSRELPVLWHQSLLTFVQRYKGDVSTEQRESLLELLKHQSHPSVTPEIRREFQHAKCRDVESMVQ
jgi:hypothetical protein